MQCFATMKYLTAWGTSSLFEVFIHNILMLPSAIMSLIDSFLEIFLWGVHQLLSVEFPIISYYANNKVNIFEFYWGKSCNRNHNLSFCKTNNKKRLNWRTDVSTLTRLTGIEQRPRFPVHSDTLCVGGRQPSKISPQPHFGVQHYALDLVSDSDSWVEKTFFDSAHLFPEVNT